MKRIRLKNKKRISVCDLNIFVSEDVKVIIEDVIGCLTYYTLKFSIKVLFPLS